MATRGKTEASVVSTEVRGQPRYPMFEADHITAEGAFFAGPLLLEVGERFTVELALEGGPVRVHARVAEVARGATSGMDVRFEDVAEDAKRKLDGCRNAG